MIGFGDQVEYEGVEWWRPRRADVHSTKLVAERNATRGGGPLPGGHATMWDSTPYRSVPQSLRGTRPITAEPWVDVVVDLN